MCVEALRRLHEGALRNAVIAGIAVNAGNGGCLAQKLWRELLFDTNSSSVNADKPETQVGRPSGPFPAFSSDPGDPGVPARSRRF